MRTTTPRAAVRLLLCISFLISYTLAEAQIVCNNTPTEIFCTDDLSAVPSPIAVLQPGEILELTASDTTYYLCGGAIASEVPETYERRYQIRRANGTLSPAICTQTITVKKIVEADVIWPANLQNEDALSCEITALPFSLTGLPEVCLPATTSFANGPMFTNRNEFKAIAFDADGDGVEDDLAVTTIVNATMGASEKNVVYINNNGAYTLLVELGDPVIGADVVAFDADGDGNKDDLAFANFDANPEIYINNNGTFVLAAEITGVSQASGIDAMDVDGDGLEDDLVFSGLTGDKKYALYNGSSPIVAQTIPSSGFLPSYTDVVAFDLDGDGSTNNVAITGTTLFGGAMVYVYEVGSSVFTLLASVPLPGITIAEGHALDYNDDGNIDLAFASTNGGGVVLTGDGTSLTAGPSFGSGFANGLDVLDADLDGLEDDIVLANITGDDEIWTYDGATFSLAATINPTSGNQSFTVLATDINADGKTDVIAIGQDYMNATYYNYSTVERCIELDPDTQILAGCHSALQAVNDTLQHTDCLTRIRKEWNYYDWSCTPMTTFGHSQFINIKDKEGPQFTCPADMTVSTGWASCSATLALPVPVATDNCNQDGIRLDIGVPPPPGVGVPSYIINDYAGQMVELPVGIHKIYYTYYDVCSNPTNCDFLITVEDNDDPIAVCEPNLVQGLGSSGTAMFMAMTLDGGSFDECDSFPTIQIARVLDPGFDDRSAFADMLILDCSDLGELMVGLLVTDKSGNTNLCMTSVHVVDEVDGRLECPMDVTVDCNAPFDPNNLDSFFGAPTIIDNCPASNYTRDSIKGTLTDCGTGLLTREISLYNAQDVLIDFCTQLITFSDGMPLTESMITWPPANLDFTGCLTNLDAQNLDTPSVPMASCSNIMMRKEEQVFPFNGSQACSKVIRTWFVIDWCIPQNDRGGALDPFTFEQTIKVINNEAPFFSSVPVLDSLICIAPVNCDTLVQVTYLQAVAEDLCTAASLLHNEFEVTDEDGVMVNSGNTLNANGSYGIGKYHVAYSTEDLCGNEAVYELDFEIKSCKVPIAYCKSFTANLVGMDLDNNGINDAEMVTVTPMQVNAGSYQPCGAGVSLSFSADPLDVERTFNCDSIGVREVQLWVTNDLGFTNFCRVDVLVEDNNTDTICGSTMTGTRVGITGHINTATNIPVENVLVTLAGAQLPSKMTTVDGGYEYADMETGGTYGINPQKNDGHTNGVNTLDLIHIQRHLLGLELFTSPYQYIAADINNDESIKPNDLLALRKVILGVSDYFPNNTSWRFVDAAHVFVDLTDPLTDDLPSTYDIQNLQADMAIDFTAVKVGDLNGDVVPHTFATDGIDTRSLQTFEVTATNRQTTSDQVIWLDVRSAEEALLHGLQGELQLKGYAVSGITPGRMTIDMNSIYQTDGKLKISHAEAIGVEVAAQDILFTLELTSTGTSTLSESIKLSQGSISNEAYLGSNLETASLLWTWQENVHNENNGQPLEISQNRPNPWTNFTTLNISTQTDGNVNINFFDATGKLIYQKSDYLSAGNYEITLTENEIPVQGLILYEVNQAGQKSRGKMIRVK